jgi:hypothetical protein
MSFQQAQNETTIERRTRILNQYPALKKLHDQSVEDDYHKRDYSKHSPTFVPGLNEGKTQLIPQDKLHGLESVRYSMTENAWTQLGSKLGSALHGKGSGRSLPKPWLLASADHENHAVRSMFAGQMNALSGIATNDLRKSWFIRTYKQQCRAVLSDRYAAVDNTQIIRLVASSLDMQANQMGSPNAPKFTRRHLTPDSLGLDVLMKGVNPRDDQSPDTPGENPYGLGFRIKNNEIGTGCLMVAPYIQRNSCTNSIVIADGAFKVAHIGLSYKLLSDMTAAIGQALMLSVEYMEHLLKSRTVEIPNFHAKIDEMCKSLGWGEDFAHSIRTGSEGRETQYGLVNGVTFAAQLIEDPDERMNREEIGGRILANPKGLFKSVVDREWVTAGTYVTVDR